MADNAEKKPLFGKDLDVLSKQYEKRGPFMQN